MIKTRTREEIISSMDETIIDCWEIIARIEKNLEVEPMKQQMTIDQFELKQLLTGEINFVDTDYSEDIGESIIDMEYGEDFDGMTLEYMGGQEYFVIDSSSDEVFPGETISVDEILDIVL